MSVIIDGTGTGNQAKVDSEKRLRVFAVTQSGTIHNNLEENSYNLNTGLITLTSANESAVMYFKNNENNPYVITAVAVGLGPSTGGVATSIPFITVTRNPTGGTVVDDESAVSINSNRNFGSTNTLTADVYKGAEGKTLTGDVEHLLFYQATSGRLYATIDEVLPKGTSIGVKVTPPTSNTSMTCYVALVGYLQSDGEVE
jgi:hypothetical protein